MRTIRGKWLRFRDIDYVLDFLRAMAEPERRVSTTIPGRVNRCTAPEREYYARYRGECHTFRSASALKRAMLTVPAVCGERATRLAECQRLGYVHDADQKRLRKALHREGREVFKAAGDSRDGFRACSHPHPCNWCREDAGMGRALKVAGSRPEMKLSPNRRTRLIAGWVRDEMEALAKEESE